MGSQLGVLRVAEPPEIEFLEEEVIARFRSGDVVIEMSSGYGAYQAAVEGQLRRLHAHLRNRQKCLVVPLYVCTHPDKPCEKPGGTCRESLLPPVHD